MACSRQLICVPSLNKQNSKQNKTNPKKPNKTPKQNKPSKSILENANKQIETGRTCMKAIKVFQIYGTV